MAERDLTGREDKFVGLCLVAAAIIVLFAFIVIVIRLGETRQSIDESVAPRLRSPA
jgi:hypothetical protein